jgi:hypothetical protein
VTAGFEGAARPALAYIEAELIVRRWVAGKANWRARGDLRARLKLREAMVARGSVFVVD